MDGIEQSISNLTATVDSLKAIRNVDTYTIYVPPPQTVKCATNLTELDNSNNALDNPENMEKTVGH